MKIKCKKKKKIKSPPEYGIPEDVAGATLMALGCNGPELFTNVIALFVTHSDLGVGTIIGSEIFNLLLIVGGSILAAPKTPLELNKVPFIRDSAFYLISIILLLWVLWDGKVTFFESCVLLFFCAVFATTVRMI
jgi:Ca2+/Na+ antiporter